MKCEAYFIGAVPISLGRNLWIKQKGPRISPRPCLSVTQKKTVGFGLPTVLKVFYTIVRLMLSRRQAL
jgi:hypothetical protein